jgi:hypothetical protein
MEFAIRSVSEASMVSGQTFVPGDRVWSVLYRTAEGAVERADVLAGERDQLRLEGEVLCQWGHRIKEPEVSEAEERRAALQSREEIFLSLFEAEEGEAEETPEVRETRDRMKFFLSLELERKRILRPLGRGRYRHVASKRELTVPQLELTPDLVASHLRAEGLEVVPADNPEAEADREPNANQ